MLGQFDLTSEDIAGAVTDAGVEIRSALAKAFPWEWCLPHLLNRVAIEGSGMAPTRLQSKNLPCRALVECMRGVMELFSKSGLCKVGVLFWGYGFLGLCVAWRSLVLGFMFLAFVG